MDTAAGLVQDVRQAARSLPSTALNLLLPPRCLGCGVAVERNGALCSDCWDRISFIAPPCCAVCGYPFEFDMGPEALCGSCARETPLFDRARAVMAYDETSRRLLLGFKHGDRSDGAPAFAAWMARAGADLLRDSDLILPVPLHRLRLFRRRYNQAALLAVALGRLSGCAVATGLLQRRRNTPSQGRLSPAARRQNVAGAFVVPAGKRSAIEGRRVLLVDDVLTSGATVEACAGVLKRSGARGVDVLVLARVLRAQS